jgi:hypothetical protein
MTILQEQWRSGYLDGWAEQGTEYPTFEPTVPPTPPAPNGVSDEGEWAYNAGKHQGVLDRARRQAGLL